jgi:hypothetical protein
MGLLSMQRVLRIWRAETSCNMCTVVLLPSAVGGSLPLCAIVVDCGDVALWTVVDCSAMLLSGFRLEFPSWL